METIYFGGGCFWCVEAVFEQLRGVANVVSGYMGGHIKHPSYREVCTGITGHAEVVRVDYHPAEISLDDLMLVFWTTHDPTTLNRQGADKGTQYRSVIFYTTPLQKQTALVSREKIAPEIWSDQIVTEIVPADDFYIAEQYHQDFYQNNPDQGYCAVVIPPKIKKLKTTFAHLLKSE